MIEPVSETFYRALDKQGNDTGLKLPKGQVHGPNSRKDLFCATAHIWIYNQRGEVLVQKRSKHMSTWPNCWDISSAGHIDFGEEPLQAAVREIHEELGLSAQQRDLEFINKQVSNVPTGQGWSHNEFTWVYVLKEQGEPHFTMQKEEVAELKWLQLAELDVEVHDPVLSKNYVPHGEYYDRIITEIRKRL